MADQYARAEECVDAAIARVGKTIVLGLPLALGKANHLANAFYARARTDPDLDLTIFTALTRERPAAPNALAARLRRRRRHDVRRDDHHRVRAARIARHAARAEEAPARRRLALLVVVLLLAQEKLALAGEDQPILRQSELVWVVPDGYGFARDAKILNNLASYLKYLTGLRRKKFFGNLF